MRTFILAIGISDYLIEGVTDLPPCVRDAEEVALALGALAPPGTVHATLLLNEQATKRAIQEALTAIAGEVGEGERVCFYFSGHGALAPASVGSDEEDSLEEYLCPVDIRDMAGTGTMIQDNELYWWLDPIRQQGAELVLIVDSCHSGTIHRTLDMTAVAKALPEHVIAKMQSAAPSSPQRVPPPPEGVEPRQLLLAACQDFQQAHIVLDAPNSLFTGHLLAEVRADPATTFQALFERLQPRVEEAAEELGVEQRPNLVDGIGASVPLRHRG